MDIMHAIMDIEQKAQAIVNSTGELKKSQNTILNEELEKRRIEMDALLKEQCAKLKQENTTRRAEKMVELEKEYGDKLELLNRKCQDGKEKWVLDIVTAIIGEQKNV